MARQLKWYTTLLDEQAIVSGGQKHYDILPDLEQANAKGATVTRMVLKLWGIGDTGNSRKITDYGVLWVSGDAFTASAVPELDDQSERPDFLFRGRMYIVGNVPSEVQQVAQVSHDVRSQRICRTDDDKLTLVVDLNAITAGGIFLTIFARVLVRLP